MAGNKCGLSRGAIEDIKRGIEVLEPRMQLLGISKPDHHYKIDLSDGKHLTSATLFSKASVLVSRNVEEVINSIIKIKKYDAVRTDSEGKGHTRVLMIIDMEMVVPGNNCTKIGSPVQLPDCYSETSAATPSTSRPSHLISELTTELNRRPLTTNDTEALSPAKKTMNSVQLRNDDPESSAPARSTRNASSTISNRPSSGNTHTHLISELTTELNRWRIMARVTYKTPIRRWKSLQGESKRFTVQLLDKSDEIQATAYEDEEVNKFYEMLEVGKVYYISKCKIKKANKTYSPLKNVYEMSFKKQTTIDECEHAIDCVPQAQYHFSRINELKDAEDGSFVDVIGVCINALHLESVTRIDGSEAIKRDIELIVKPNEIDEQPTKVKATLWELDAENFSGSSKPIVFLKGAQVNVRGYKERIELKVLYNTFLQINPDIPEAHALRRWFDDKGFHIPAKPLFRRIL